MTTALVTAAGRPSRRAAASTAWRSLPGIELGVEIARAARGGDALEEGDVAREEQEAVAVGGEPGGERIAVTLSGRLAVAGVPLRFARCFRPMYPLIARQSAPHPRSFERERDGLLTSATRCAPRMGRMPAASQARWNSMAP